MGNDWGLGESRQRSALLFISALPVLALSHLFVSIEGNARPDDTAGDTAMYLYI